MKDSIRTVLNFPIEGVEFRDITGLLEDPKAFKDSIVALQVKQYNLKRM